MDARIRLVPPALLVALVVARMFQPEFLAKPVIEAVPIVSWFGLVFVVLLYVTAWLLTPGFVRVVNTIARWGLVPPIFFATILLGLLWFADFAWNEFIDPWCDPCGQSHILESITAAIHGGT